jgi:hypothetical protein
MRIRDLVQGAAYRHINHPGATWVYREHAFPATYIFDVTNPDGTTDVWAFDLESVRDYLTPAPRTPEEIAWEAVEDFEQWLAVQCDDYKLFRGFEADSTKAAFHALILAAMESQ